MDCCSVNGLNKVFNESKARKESEAYRRKGLGKRARKLTDLVETQDISEATVLDIGCGVGALHLELLKQGAGRAIGVEVSSAYVEAATSLAQSLGFQDAVEYHDGDFVQLEEGIPQADIVLLDRVVCCYPDMEALVTASARHAQRLYALTYPRRTWWMRVAAFMMNLGLTVVRRQFRFFLHHPRQIGATLASAGFSPVHWATSGPWELAVYQRQ